MLKNAVENVRMCHPLIHCITNYVTANDCANILLACGAAPIMSDDADEVSEVTAISQGLNLNLGTLSQGRVRAMLRAGMEANRRGIPVLLDPVGVGVTKFRTDTAKELLEKIHFSVIRGNISEVRALSTGVGSVRGVDSDWPEERLHDLRELSAFARQMAAQWKTIVVITGKTDIVSDSDKTFYVQNGNEMMGKITGSGCQLSSLITAYLAASKEPLEAVLAAVCLMGRCGEKAFDRMTDADGNASYLRYLIDAVYQMTGDELEQTARYHLAE